jgi:hypothetical protein
MMSELNDPQIIVIVRYFNLALNIGAFIMLLFWFQKHSIYKRMNIVFGLALLYGIVVYTEALIHGHTIAPIFSALGSTFNTLAILAAIISQVEDNHEQ